MCLKTNRRPTRIFDYHADVGMVIIAIASAKSVRRTETAISGFTVRPGVRYYAERTLNRSSKERYGLAEMCSTFEDYILSVAVFGERPTPARGSLHLGARKLTSFSVFRSIRMDFLLKPLKSTVLRLRTHAILRWKYLIPYHLAIYIQRRSLSPCMPSLSPHRRLLPSPLALV
jgi:hypothetical protein